MNEPVLFHNRPASEFPVTIELIAEDTGELLYRTVLEGPRAVRIPACGRPVMSRVTSPTGVVVVASNGAVREGITCPQCGRTSFYPKGVSERYCGNCHQFHEEMGTP